jgi:hypothetical protein
MISDSLKSRVGPGNWKLWKTSYKLEEENESVDLIYVSDDGKKEKYILVDVSIPHLQVGQKYLLPAKAKQFQKQENVPLTRIKKAIVLVRKGTETISARPARIRCPIIEIQLEKITQPDKKTETRPQRKEHSKEQNKEHSKDQGKEPVQEKKPSQGVSQELLFALKEAIVHECLSTMHKRRNKYIRKGLWRWIEREIMDPNVHFYLIILSTIYQGKAGDVLSRKFKTVEAFSDQAEEVISAIFSKETNLADEIKKNSERHKKALRKFLACFSQTPPFEYLRSLFLKEFRSNQDGLKARLSVFTTLNQLLERCGFEGEKETQYPLEILAELGIFQGIMTGNYARLRIDNAGKKLKHLVPQVEWNEEDIYQLRNQLAKALNLPAQEFNLNAFLPQAFFHDARVMAEARKEAFRAAPRPEPQAKPSSEKRDKNEAASDTGKRDSRRHEQRRPEREKPSDDSAQTNEIVSEESVKEAAVLPDTNIRREKRRLNECDEASHRNFEFFGGQTEEDIDSVRLALAMSRHESEKLQAMKKAELDAKEAPVIDEDEEDLNHRPPLKVSNDKPYAVNHMPPKRRPTRSSGNSNNPNRNNRRRKPGGKPTGNKRHRKPSGQNNGNRS